MQGREARVESGEYAGKIRRRHGQANYGATECRLCLGIVMPLGAIFQSIYRKPGSTGSKLGLDSSRSLARRAPWSNATCAIAQTTRTAC